MDEKAQTSGQSDIEQRLSRAISQQMGFPVLITRSGENFVLNGEADSDSGRAEAQATLQELVPGVKIFNLLSVNEHRRMPDGYADRDLRGDLRPPAGSESLDAAEGSDLDAGFNDQPLETNAINVADESVPDLDVPAEPDPAYFASTDPVLGTDDQGGPEIVGGFDPTSMTEDTVDRSTIDGQPGDEAIADAVRRELHEDAETTGLPLTVAVEDGVVRLRGRVADLTDAEDAEEVASRVPGVREVIDETEVSAL
jgi:BON domain